jgi:class 3 adenylate cyclase
VERAPQTQYAAAADGVSLAYQVVGEGPIDLLFVPGWVNHVDWAWEYPGYARLLERLASFARLVWFDKRGLGLSDRPERLPTLEDQMSDVGTVLNAAGSDRAALFGTQDGTAPCLFYAAAHPERIFALVLYAGMPRFLASDDYPFGVPQQVVDHWLHRFERAWGQDVPSDLEPMAPSRIRDAVFRKWYAQFCRLAASPSAIRELVRVITNHDMRAVLPAVRVPTLVLNRTFDAACRVENAKYMAEHIPEARFVALAGEDSLIYAGDSDPVIDEVQEFLTGVRDSPNTERILVTVLFTDIVASTQRADSLGDRRWRELLDAYDRVIERQLERFRGHKVDSAGDGMLATFDGPARAVHCAQACIAAARAIDLDIRAGIHTGEVEVRGDNIGGIAVHIGARVASLAGAGEVLVTRTVTDLVAGSGLRFEDRGEHTLKGVPQPWQLCVVAS